MAMLKSRKIKILIVAALSFAIAIVLSHVMLASNSRLNDHLAVISRITGIHSMTNAAGDNPWRNAPSLSLIVRMWHGSAAEYWQVFAPSYLMFWPIRSWLNSDLILVFDDESYADHQISLTLSLLPPYPKIKFEKHPSNGTLCSDWRSEGYSRQMYSNFFVDEQTEAPFIGIADADTMFSTKIVPEDLFENGKPRILGYNGCCTNYEIASSLLAEGRKPGEFMIVLGFPFIVRREHLKPFREHVVKTFNRTFDQAFNYICSKFSGKYSQFNMLAYYLFYYHRDDYSWHIIDNDYAHEKYLQRGRMTNDPEVLQLDVPKIGVMKSNSHMSNDKTLLLLRDFACVQENFTTLGCENEPLNRRPAIADSIHYNLMTDFLSKPALWGKRGLPWLDSLSEPYERAPVNASDLLAERQTWLEKYKGSWHW